MAKISAAQVKELRDKTGVGMMDAKKALVETEGDMEKAVDVLREKGVAKAEKKSGRVAAEGIAAVAIKDNKAAIVEINCETDSVASTDKFKNLVTEVADKVAEEEPASVDDALALKTANGTVKDDVIETTQVTGEKISLRRFQVVEKGADQSFGSYIHNGGQIAALVVLDGADSATAKDVAMHVAAINPEYVNREQVPADRLAHEKDVLVKEALNEGKPEKIVEKMVEGRLNKWLSEISLDDQEFVKDSDQTVAHFVESKGGKVSSFIRFEVGEGIEKKADNFIDEVMNQIKD
ncbi:translation elongation factor Ts [Lactiplantibacillus plantarum]|uniref:translation elongation factor Ts n=1 Tax=Lactiplantibacillus plantarum TaxID=1590 RepID=UPI0007B545B6|nr:translation elongation factor Ts [Lactiplantibacillus plantarum]ARW13464.1 Elongation factor Ts [Lactiplantibacillus plantarum subsp. plantarum]AUS71312.1 Elongation factor Ts [Lactiplantibacillus plantarum]KZU31589.1 Translation elongation factor Ts [Lactiplantibacillus plantarum]KZU78072.1 Translation elongation factor Ts [Lactiplantibacillus plantarum]MBA2819445.1 Elongation factor Ts [Lactiplantibacillus plantarum]